MGLGASLLSKDSVSSKSPEDALYLDYSPRNLAIFTNCFSVGYAMYYILAPISFYMIDELDAPAQKQGVVTGLMFLPWGLKLAWGLIIDTAYGGKRKIFLPIGWGLFVLSNLVLICLVKPSILPLAFLTFLSTIGYVMADVATDAMMVERSKQCERTAHRGQLQARAYIARFAGGTVGCIVGAVLYNKDAWGWGLPFWGVLCVYIATPILFIAPWYIPLLELEDTDEEGNPIVPESITISAQFGVLYNLFQQTACWKPCTFIFLYNMSLLINPAWNSFLVCGLGFSNFALAMLTLLGNLLAYLALVCYKKYFFETSWRKIYLWCTALYLFFTSLQYVLIFKLNDDWNMGAQGYAIFFAMSSYGMVQFIQAIQFLPSCRLYLALCPKGSEGTTYAMLTSLANLASTTTYPLAASLSTIWDVRNDTLDDGDYDGMWKLTLLCSAFVLPTLLLIDWLPDGMDDVVASVESGEVNKRAGTALTAVVALALVFTIGFTLITII